MDTLSCDHVDDTFGPYAGAACRGGFDFTRLFEDAVLAILPLALVLLVLPPRLYFLLRCAERKLVGSRDVLLLAKMSAWLVLGILQLASLILWATAGPEERTHATLPAAALALVTTLGLCLLSHAEHVRTVRPSSLLSGFLVVTLLFDVARARTLWLWASTVDDDDDDIIGDGVGHHDLAAVFTIAVATKLCLVILEGALQKRCQLRPAYQFSCPPEATAGILDRAFFWWLNPLFRKGFGHVLGLDDLYALDTDLKATYLYQRFQIAWTAVASKPAASLLGTSFGVVKWSLVQTIFPRACFIAFTYCQPFLINRAITLSQESVNDETTQVGYGLIGAYLLVYVGLAVSMGQYQHKTYRTITMLRGGLVSMIYRKTGTLSLRDIDPAASMTLMSADMERIVQGCQTMHEIWANVIEVGLAIYLLERQLGVACVVPVGVSILSLLGSMAAMSTIMSRQAEWLEAIEKRISATSSMLDSMKGIKMCGLRDTLLASLQKLRVDELRISKRFRKLIIWNMVFAYVTQVFAPVLTFAVFSVRARDSGDTTLDTARIFTSLSLFALLAEPLSSLVMSLSAFLAGAGSFARMQQFLLSDDRSGEPGSKSKSLEARANGFRDDDDDEDDAEDDEIRRPSIVKFSNSYSNSSSNENGNKNNEAAAVTAAAISVQHSDFGWDATKPPLLRDITLTLPRRRLTMVVGPVGCGKSTLLQALLGEVPTLAGDGAHLHLHSRSLAYCAQSPWHMNGTVREAIVGVDGAPFDEKWYARVVRACALERDLEELAGGDETPIGSGGVALSGGQSQRLALARAVYARREIVLLDDTFSGLDTITEDHVFHGLLGENGILRQIGSTVVLVSSSAKRLPYADYIVCLGPEGVISSQGTFAELENGGGYVSSLIIPGTKTRILADHVNETGSLDTVPTDVQADDYIDEKLDVSSLGKNAKATIAPTELQVEIDASRQVGDVKIYLYYVKSVGWVVSLVFVLAIVGFIFCTAFPNVWVQWWAADNESHPNSLLGYWLGLYAAYGGIAIVCLFISCWQMIITMVPKSGEKFHYDLLKTVLRAPMSFFVNTDSGVTMNRFSQDLQLIDMELPIAALNTFATLVLCMAQMALIGVGSVYAAISFPIVLLALYLIQRLYLRTSRQLRLLDLEAKAPLYSLFEESLRGLATVRAFGWRRPLRRRNAELLDRSQQPFYLLFAVQRWLTLVLDLLVAAVAVLLMALVVALRQVGGPVRAGGVGLALLGVIQFGQTVKLLVTFWTTLETHIGSVARIKSFTETAVPEDLPEEDQQPPPEWPSAGAIEFENMSAAYEDDLVLKAITLSIRAGEKIGVCGRTGSGKTTLVASLLRLADVRGGRIRVDGVDLATLPREVVRARLVAVPQRPFLLRGSVRLNADPTGGAARVDDDAVMEALRCVRLAKLVEERGGLDVDVDALNLSEGQKQLLCLARAMLRKSTILILDEATSSIDTKTEEFMQRIIRKKFAEHTVIAVAHKLDTIMDFDKVAVLDAGRLVEFDSPYTLLDRPSSAFVRLYHATVAEEEELQDKEEQQSDVAE